MKRRLQEIDKIQNNLHAKFGIKKKRYKRKVTIKGKGLGKKGEELNRKQARKAARRQKKQRRHAHYVAAHRHPNAKISKEDKAEDEDEEIKSEDEADDSDQNVSTSSKAGSSASTASSDSKSKKKVQALRKKPTAKSEISDPEEDSDEPTDQRQLYDAVLEKERAQLRELEKLLHLKKTRRGKAVNLSKAFKYDGLDYLLDVVDSEKLKTMPDKDSDDESDDDDDFEDDEDSDNDQPEVMPLRKTRKPDKSSASAKDKTSKKVRFADEENDQRTDEDDQDDIDSQEANESGSENDEDMEVDKDEDEEEEKDCGSDGVKEDIYGRLVDRKGKVVSSSTSGSTGAYIPPAKRAQMLAGSGEQSADLQFLNKQLKGLLNRANESNMLSIAKGVEELYMRNSRAAINQSLFAQVTEAVVSPALTPERLVAEMAMLVAILHGNVGTEVGAYFLQNTVKRYDELRQQDYAQDHTMDNVLLLLAYLYNFKVTHHRLLFDIITQLVKSFQEKDVELILLLLRSAGFSLRRDDPETLGSHISGIQQRARGVEEGGEVIPSRMRFMMEVLAAVRNNNVRRVPGADVERTDRFRKVAGSCVRGGGLADNQLNVGLADLLQADQVGRWWIVGSAWDGRTDSSTDNHDISDLSSKAGAPGPVSQKLVRLGKKLGMNTDIRRSIFYTLMSSEDYEDAFRKVSDLGLRDREQEVVVVCLTCCKQEATYNPFYSLLLEQLARQGHRQRVKQQLLAAAKATKQVQEQGRRFMRQVMKSMWDELSAMGELKSSSRHNLAHLLAHLLSSGAVGLDIFKKLEFGALDKAVVRFLREVFTEFFLKTPASDVSSIFRLVAKLPAVCEGLRVFLKVHLKLKNHPQSKVLNDRLNDAYLELMYGRQEQL